MSARKPTLRLTSRADRDFRGILLYTLQTWGDAQRRAYRTAVLRRLQMMTQHPYAGHSRDDLFPGCREIRVEQHLVYYHIPEPGLVEVVRILHQHQDPGGKVDLPNT